MTLETPANLVWNPQDRNTNVKYGSMGWDLVENCEGAYDIVLYKDGKYHSAMGWSDVYDDGSGKTAIDMVDAFMESGTYYFTVQAIGDDKYFYDSDIAVSDEWVYVRPDAELETPYNLMWDGNYVCWSGDTAAEMYQIVYYKDGKRRASSCGYFECDDRTGMYRADAERMLLRMYEKHGPGAYTFDIQALSGDITTLANSEVSVQSPAKM